MILCTQLDLGKTVHIATVNSAPVEILKPVQDEDAGSSSVILLVPANTISTNVASGVAVRGYVLRQQSMKTQFFKRQT